VGILRIKDCLEVISFFWNGQLKVEKYIIYFSGIEERHIAGSDFAVHETLKPYIKKIQPCS